MEIKPFYDKDGIAIYNRDYLEITKQLQDKKFDLVLTDPPYGTTACEWDTIPDLDKLWEALKPLGNSNCVYIFTASQPFTSKLIISNLKWFKYEWVWEKQKPTNFYQVKWQPLKSHENIVVFCNGRPKYYPLGTKEVCVKNGRKNKSSNLYSKYNGGDYIQKVGNYPRSVQFIPTEGDKNRVHPTQKPVALGSYLIRTYTNPGDLILDPFGGSHTFAVAALLEGRKCVSIEKDERYCEIGRKRLEEAQKKIASRLF